MTALDVEWLRIGLAADAAQVTALIIRGESADADLYLETCNYTERLAAWKAAQR